MAPGTDLRRRESDAAWSLRAAWGTQKPIRVRLRSGVTFVGFVKSVSSSDAYVLIADGDVDLIHVPLAEVDNVARPHFHETRGLPEPPPAPEVEVSLDGQTFIGWDGVPPVSRWGQKAMDRAARMLFPRDVLLVLAAVDGETKGRPRGQRRDTAPLRDIAARAFMSERRARDRLRVLEAPGFVEVARVGRRLEWRVAR